MSVTQTVLLALAGYLSLGLGVMYVINNAMVHVVRQDPEAITKLVNSFIDAFPEELRREHEVASLADRQAVRRDVEAFIMKGLDHAWFSWRDLLQVGIWPYHMVEFTIGFIQG